MRIFYGFYLKDTKLAGALDLIRFLAEPTFFRRAHITVRGPYSERIDDEIELINSRQKGPFVVDVNGVGSFYEGHQSTVFLDCTINGVEDIWYKPDFSNSKPHMTLFDRRDANARSVGNVLKDFLELYPWRLSAEATALTLIEGKKIPSESALQNYFRFANEWSIEILGRSIDFNGLRNTHWRERLKYIPEICKYVHNNYINK